jgi:hypothetical protein
LAVETKVDAQVKKLSGEVMFKLILFSMLNSDKLSLRVMETFLRPLLASAPTRQITKEPRWRANISIPVSFAVINWVDLFIRNEYKQVLLKSFEHYIETKGLELDALR